MWAMFDKLRRVGPSHRIRRYHLRWKQRWQPLRNRRSMREQEISSRRRTNHSVQTAAGQMGSAGPHGYRRAHDIIPGMAVSSATNPPIGSIKVSEKRAPQHSPTSEGGLKLREDGGGNIL